MGKGGDGDLAAISRAYSVIGGSLNEPSELLRLESVSEEICKAGTNL